MAVAELCSTLELTELLNSAGTCDEYRSVIERAALSVADIDQYCRWDTKRYTRNCLMRTPNYELLLLCWEKGQYTAIHDHNDQECWMCVVDGEITEERYTLSDDRTSLKKVGVENCLPRGVVHINDSQALHRLINNAPGRTITMHLYAKPIETCLVFDQTTAQATVRNLYYTSFAPQARRAYS